MRKNNFITPYSMQTVTVSTHVLVPVEKAWNIWNDPEDIMQWYHASDDWYVPHAENDLGIGGKFIITMAARDESSRFDFNGIYTNIILFERIEYTIDDGRKVTILFKQEEHGTTIAETFETENINTVEQQRFGWQAILENFKIHAEKVGKKMGK